MNKAKCPNCSSTNITLMTRIVGYFSSITSWNKSKLEELKSRRKGNYRV